MNTLPLYQVTNTLRKLGFQEAPSDTSCQILKEPTTGAVVVIQNQAPSTTFLHETKVAAIRHTLVMHGLIPESSQHPFSALQHSGDHYYPQDETTEYGMVAEEPIAHYGEESESEDALSENEKKLLGLLLKGKSDESISETLGIDLHTVKSQESRLFQKLSR